MTEKVKLALTIQPPKRYQKNWKLKFTLDQEIRVPGLCSFLAKSECRSGNLQSLVLWSVTKIC